MGRHPSNGTLRRLLDEPVAVPLVDQRHADGCTRCRARMASTSDEDAVVRSALEALGEVPEITPADEALRRLHQALDGAESRPGLRHAGPARRRLLRPTVVIAGALVLTGAATAAAATGLVPIFQPESVTPIVVQAGDLSGLAGLSSFGTFSGDRDLKVTPEGSSGALRDAAGFAVPSVQPPAGVEGAPSYWLISPDYAQVDISVERIDQAAASAGVTPPAAPPGIDGSTLRVSTGYGVLEIWGSINFPGTSGNDGSSTGPVSGSEGFFGHSISRAAAPGSGAPSGTAGGDSSLADDVPQLAVAEVQGPTVSSSGVSLSTLEAYLLSQPEVSPALAAEIRSIGNPTSTLPLPVPAGAATTTTELNGHEALVYNLGDAAHLVVWAAAGQTFAVVGQLSTAELVEVAEQVG